AQARGLATGWRAAGYSTGDVIGVVGDGGLPFALAMLSAGRAGLVPVLLDPRLTNNEIAVVFERARPRAIALCAGATLPASSDVPVFAFDRDGCADLAGAGAHHEPPPVVRAPHAAAVLIVTSG